MLTRLYERIFNMDKFKIGDKVYKPLGYKFDAIIVAVFQTTAGLTRIVAENTDGLLHIFNEKNLELCELSLQTKFK